MTATTGIVLNDRHISKNAPISARWPHAMRVVYPRLFQAGVDLCLRGNVKHAKPTPITYRLGHNTALQALDACTALKASKASDAFEPSSHGAIYATHALHDSAPEGPVATLQGAAAMALGYGINESSMWNFARALKGFEAATGCTPELGGALAVWWPLARLPDTESFEEYLTDLQDCFSRVKTALGSNVLELVEASLPPIPDNPSFDARFERLKALCVALSRHAAGAFFLSLRDAGRISKTTDPYAVKKMMNRLLATGFLKCVEKGTAAGRKASRYTVKA